MVDPLVGVAIGAVLGFVTGWALKYLGPKSQLVYWFPHSSFFQIPQPGQPNLLSLVTNAVTVQNLGRRSATSVEVVYSTPPTHINVTPARAHTVNATPQGQHVLLFPSLGHNEWFTLEVLAFGIAPAVISVRSADGPAKLLPVITQRVWPRWVTAVFAILILVGGGLAVYWILRGLRFLAHAVGLL